MYIQTVDISMAVQECLYVCNIVHWGCPIPVLQYVLSYTLEAVPYEASTPIYMSIWAVYCIIHQHASICILYTGYHTCQLQVTQPVRGTGTCGSAVVAPDQRAVIRAHDLCSYIHDLSVPVMSHACSI